MGVQAVRHGRDAPENGERSQMERHTGRVKAASWAAALALALGAGMIPLRAAGPGAGGKPAAAAAEPIPEPSVPPGKVILQWDHLVDSNDRTLEDYWGFVSYKQTHYQARSTGRSTAPA